MIQELNALNIHCRILACSKHHFSLLSQPNLHWQLSLGEITDANCLIDAQNVIVNVDCRFPVRLTPTQASLCPRGYLHSHMCVCGLRSRAVRSAFHCRQHKVIPLRPSAGGAPSASTVQFHCHSTVILCSPSAMVATLCSQDKPTSGYTIVWH